MDLADQSTIRVSKHVLWVQGCLFTFVLRFLQASQAFVVLDPLRLVCDNMRADGEAESEDDADLMILIQSFGLVELGQNTDLAGWQMSSHAFTHVRHEGNDEAEALRCEREVFGSNVFQPGATSRTGAEDELA